MNDIMIAIVAFAGGYNISVSLLMNTTGILYTTLFKIIPFFTGLGCLFVSGKMAGLI